MRHRFQPARLVVGSAVAAVLIAGCGSTVQGAGRNAPGGSIAGNGFTTGSGATHPGAPDSGSNGPASPGASQPAGGIGSTLGGTTAADSSASAADTRATGTGIDGGDSQASAVSYPPGVSDTQINLGLAVSENRDEANEAFGAAGITFGDQRRRYEIIIDDINEHGGVLGRELNPIFHTVDAQSAQTRQQLEQSTCADYTQDHETFIVVDAGSPNFKQCLFNNGVTAITSEDATADDDAEFARWPAYFTIGNMSLDRSYVAMVSGLQRQGYFGGKLGILTADWPPMNRAVDNSLVPALQGIGHSPAVIVRVFVPDSNAELGRSAADVQNAILRFRSEGVDHVIITDTAGSLTLMMLNQAESQGYRPVYGFNSQNVAELLLHAGLIPKEQVQGAKGVGWWPYYDIAPPENPVDGPHSNSARKSCLRLMKEHDVTFADTNSEAGAVIFCDRLYFIREALEAGGELTRAGVLAGIERLGDSFVSGLTIATSFADGRRDGAAVVRDHAYIDACTCFRYVSGNHNV